MPRAATLRTSTTVVACRHWRAGRGDNSHAQFGGGPTEKDRSDPAPCQRPTLLGGGGAPATGLRYPTRFRPETRQWPTPRPPPPRWPAVFRMGMTPAKLSGAGNVAEHGAVALTCDAETRAAGCRCCPSRPHRPGGRPEQPDGLDGSGLQHLGGPPSPSRSRPSAPPSTSRNCARAGAAWPGFESAAHARPAHRPHVPGIHG